MIIQLENRKINVRINHNYVNGVGRSTTCTVKENDVIIAEATSFVGPKDEFKRKIGLNVAVSRALKGCGFTKAEREKIWDKIWNSKYSKRKEKLQVEKEISESI